MSDLHKAAQAALEFLESGDFVYPAQLADDIRAALAQEPAQQEPNQSELDKVNARIEAAVEENFGYCPNEKWFSDLLDLRDAYERQLEVGVKK